MRSPKSLKIVMPGGSGQVGHTLARHFLAEGHRVTVLSRNPQPAPWRVIAWNPSAPGPWVEELENSDVCINLAGRSVNCRYSAENRRVIYDSRIGPTQLLAEVMPSLRLPPRLWLNASTATIYRHSLDRRMDEATGELGGNEPGVPDTWNFSIKVAKDWEAAFFSRPDSRTRQIALRSSIICSPDRGGIFEVLSRLVWRGLGGTIGTGSQVVSWIHDNDFVRAIDFLIADERFDGAVNVASPNPVPNRDFMRVLRESWGVHLGLPSSEWMIEIGSFIMRTESELVLKSRNVVPGRLLAAGFEFHFPDLPTAARDLVSRWR